MNSIPELPEAVISDLESNAEATRVYLSKYYYEDLVAKNSDHLLVRISERFDFVALEESCASYHKHEAGGRGQEAVHDVRLLCRTLVVQKLYDWSYRQTAEEIKSQPLMRWFVGYTLFDVTMSYGTFYNFARWVKEEGLAREFFTHFLLQIDEDYPEERSLPQVGDTFALESRAIRQTHTDLLKNASLKVLSYLALQPARDQNALLSNMDREALFGPEDEKPQYLLKKEERIEREEQTALAAIGLLAAVQTILTTLPPSQSVERIALDEWVARLEKILHDEFLFTVDEEGWVTKATLREKHEKGAFAIGSTVDPEATFRNHGKKSELGYNINVAATKRFVREINAVTGATADGSGVAPLVANQLVHLGVVPPKLIYDQAAGYPKYFAQVHRVSHGETQLVARLVRGGRKPNLFGPQDFTLDENGHLTCPNGQVSIKPFRKNGNDSSGWTYPFYPSQCKGCELMERCRKKNVKPNSRRTVFISDYLYNQREAIAYSKTDDFGLDMKFRANIERIIAGLTRYNGARRAHAYGLDNADYQVKMAGMAYNLKRWGALQRQEELQERKRIRLLQRQRQEQHWLPQPLDHQHLSPCLEDGQPSANAPPSGYEFVKVKVIQ